MDLPDRVFLFRFRIIFQGVGGYQVHEAECQEVLGWTAIFSLGAHQTLGGKRVHLCATAPGSQGLARGRPRESGGYKVTVSVLTVRHFLWQSGPR